MDGEELGPTPDEMGLTPEDTHITESGQNPEKDEHSPTEASNGFLTEWADRLNIDEWADRFDKASMVVGPLATGIAGATGNPEAAMYLGTLTAFNSARVLIKPMGRGNAKV